MMEACVKHVTSIDRLLILLILPDLLEVVLDVKQLRPGADQSLGLLSWDRTTLTVVESLASGSEFGVRLPCGFLTFEHLSCTIHLLLLRNGLRDDHGLFVIAGVDGCELGEEFFRSYLWLA